MIRRLRAFGLMLFAAMVIALPPPLHAAPPGSEIGVVVMHGKGGRPGEHVHALAAALEREGFQVANLEMPWSGSRDYDVDMNGGVAEITGALDAMRAKGARKVFVAGHSQGGLFALHYGGLHKVDGVVAIAPGGLVDVGSFVRTLGQHVATARQMVAEGRGSEKADFADFEGARGTNSINTTAAIYLDWFDPGGAHTGRALRNVMPATPVLYVAPTRDHPGLKRAKDRMFGALPPNPATRLYEPNADHTGAPAASAGEVARWIREVAQRAQ